MYIEKDQLVEGMLVKVVGMLGDGNVDLTAVVEDVSSISYGTPFPYEEYILMPVSEVTEGFYVPGKNVYRIDSKPMKYYENFTIEFLGMVNKRYGWEYDEVGTEDKSLELVGGRLSALEEKVKGVLTDEELEFFIRGKK